MKLALVISAVIAVLSLDPGAFAKVSRIKSSASRLVHWWPGSHRRIASPRKLQSPSATAPIYADTRTPITPRRRPTRASESIVTTPTRKTRARRSSPTSNSKEAVAADEEEGGSAGGGAGRSAAEGATAAAADSAEVAAPAGDGGSPDAAEASWGLDRASTTASLISLGTRTAQCARA